MNTAELRAITCDWARSWLGRKETDGSHREIIDIYNMGRPAGSYRMSYEDPWCAAFVSAVGMAVTVHNGLTSCPLLPHVNCDGMIAAYRAAGCWVEDDSFLPEPGDVVFYDWDDSGVGDNTGSSDHVGLVVDVRGDEITVIEGNKSDAVAYRTMQRNGRYIRGYAVPDYAAALRMAEPTEEPEQEQPKEEAPEPELKGVPTLSRGDKGWAVVSAQGILIAHRYSCGPDGADGDFGYNTMNAVCRFQRAKGLTVDGVIGPQAWAALLLGK